VNRPNLPHNLASPPGPKEAAGSFCPPTDGGPSLLQTLQMRGAAFSNRLSRAPSALPAPGARIYNERLPSAFSCLESSHILGDIRLGMPPESLDVTRLLLEWREGNQAAKDQLIDAVYGELRRLANHHLRRERPDHTLQTTALVHEAYLQLIDQRRVQWQNRAHFFGIAAHLMRRILVEYARRRVAAKRGGGALRVALDERVAETGEPDITLVALDDALRALAAFDPRQSQIVELRFFGGLTVEDTAAVTGVSTRTIKREWRLAKAWLQREISGGTRQ
jgi:RNA polymerase sigma-70 factor (ECF subfamily)